jgi:protein-S-isoprenylcysteine O-methyltransferase Ste14
MPKHPSSPIEAHHRWLRKILWPIYRMRSNSLPKRERERLMRGVVSGLGYVIMVAGLVGLVLGHAIISPASVVIVCQVVAIGLMIWARLTFGRRSFHATAGPTEGGLITSGPYRFIRHPIYTSVCLFTWASSLAYASAFTVGMALMVALGAAIRIASEERALRQRYPEYSAYAGRTKRMVPFIY